MSVSVSVPTILRPVTKGEKTVSAEGGTLAEVITDLDSRYTGLGDRLIKNGTFNQVDGLSLHPYVHCRHDHPDLAARATKRAGRPLDRSQHRPDRSTSFFFFLMWDRSTS